MAIHNIPTGVQFGCAELKVNMSLAAGIGAMAGDAATYGAFQAAFEMSNRAIHNAINPLDCANKIYLDSAGIPKVTLEYHLPDCSPITDACATGFDCTTGVGAAPSVVTQDFLIDQCSFFKISLTADVWENTCCGTEEYYKDIARARQEGGNLDSKLRAIVSRALDSGDWGMYEYKAKLIAERVQRHMNSPVTGKLAEINEYILDKLAANAGYNYTTDNAGVIVGTTAWTLPVLVPRLVGSCTPSVNSEKVIDADALRRYLERLRYKDPHCGTEFIMIGGDYFRELIDEKGILSCCDDKGKDQGAILDRALGLLKNLVYDSTIDAKFGKGTFFLVKPDSIEFFWLNMFSNSGYLTPTKAFLKMGGTYRWLPKTHLNDFDVTRFNVGNCNTGGYGLGYDTFISTPALVDGCDIPEFNAQFMSQYGLWVKPALSCGDFTGTTGVLRGQLVDVIC